MHYAGCNSVAAMFRLSRTHLALTPRAALSGKWQQVLGLGVHGLVLATDTYPLRCIHKHCKPLPRTRSLSTSFSLLNTQASGLSLRAANHVRLEYRWTQSSHVQITAPVSVLIKFVAEDLEVKGLLLPCGRRPNVVRVLIWFHLE
jgi:hypothetical protein